jgi:hypothetical protein
VRSPLACGSSLSGNDVHSTSDTDGAMRQCLSLNGKWEAPNKDDSGVALERMHQQAEDLERKIQDNRQP